MGENKDDTNPASRMHGKRGWEEDPQFGPENTQ